MEQVFESLKEVEKKIGIFLSDDENAAETIMIENAAMALETEVKNACSKKNDVVTVLCGSGNNGADGYTLCRPFAVSVKSMLSKSRNQNLFTASSLFQILKKFLKTQIPTSAFMNLHLCREIRL